MRMRRLEQRVGVLERGQSVGVQKAYSENLAAQTGITANTDLGVSCTVNIPDTTFRVIVSYSADAKGSDATTTAQLYLGEATDLPVGTQLNLGSITGTTYHVLMPRTYQENGAVRVTMSVAAFINPYSGELIGATYPTIPTAGDRTFKLFGQRTAGAGTCSYQNVRLWAAVL